MAPVELVQAELEAWGERIGQQVEPPVVLALRGELGAGKSVLARAVARGAGIDSPMPSPTFNLVFIYRSPRGADVAHLDLYRLEDPEDVWELGWSELGTGREIVLIEWPERAESLLPADRWDVRLEVVDDRRRRVRAERSGSAPVLPTFPEKVRAPEQGRMPRTRPRSESPAAPRHGSDSGSGHGDGVLGEDARE